MNDALSRPPAARVAPKPARQPAPQGTVVRLKVDSLGVGGEGVARQGGRVVFIPYACPGDTVEVRLVEVKPRFARGVLLRIIEPGPERVPPPCPYFFSPEKHGSGQAAFCGGCDWQHLAYPAQLEWKRRLVNEALERIGGLKGITVKPTLGMETPWRYRNKAQFPVAGRPGRLQMGFYQSGSHRLVDLEDCPLHPEGLMKAARATKSVLEAQRVLPYDENGQRGDMRHVVIRWSDRTGAREMTIVTRGSRPVRGEPLHKLLGGGAVYHNVQPEPTNVILGRETRRLEGGGTFTERVAGRVFRVSPGAFFQVNPTGADRLVETLDQWFQVTLPPSPIGADLLDLFCGVGLFAISLSRRFNRVWGVDDSKAAVADAIDNSRSNGCGNCRFEAGHADRLLPKIASRAGLEPQDRRRPLAVVVDPPRAGCSPETLAQIIRLAPERLAYVSCDPATLARDLKALTASGLELESVQPVDLFPQTSHIESVAVLSRGIAEGQASE